MKIKLLGEIMKQSQIDVNVAYEEIFMEVQKLKNIIENFSINPIDVAKEKKKRKKNLNKNQTLPLKSEMLIEKDNSLTDQLVLEELSKKEDSSRSSEKETIDEIRKNEQEDNVEHSNNKDENTVDDSDDKNISNESSGYSELLKNERLSKLDIETNEVIVKTKLPHDVSGTNWGNWSESLIEDQDKQ